MGVKISRVTMLSLSLLCSLTASARSFSPNEGFGVGMIASVPHMAAAIGVGYTTNSFVAQLYGAYNSRKEDASSLRGKESAKVDAVELLANLGVRYSIMSPKLLFGGGIMGHYSWGTARDSESSSPNTFRAQSDSYGIGPYLSLNYYLTPACWLDFTISPFYYIKNSTSQGHNISSDHNYLYFHQAHFGINYTF